MGCLFSSACQGGFPERDADVGVEADADGGDLDAEVDDADADSDVDGSDLDAELDDADIDADDAGTEDCDTPLDDATVALYALNDEGRWRDAVGSAPDLEHRLSGWLSRTGPDGCGEAVELFDEIGWLEAPNSATFDTVDTIDFWFLVSELPDPQGQSFGVFSRDAIFAAEPGQITLFLAADGRMLISLRNNGVSSRCSSDPIEPGRWYHILLSVAAGELELRIDGVVQNAAGPVTIVTDRSYERECRQDGAQPSIQGNTNPWVFGANMNLSSDGLTDFVTGFVSGAFDNIRFSAGPRSTPASR